MKPKKPSYVAAFFIQNDDMKEIEDLAKTLNQVGTEGVPIRVAFDIPTSAAFLGMLFAGIILTLLVWKKV